MDARKVIEGLNTRARKILADPTRIFALIEKAKLKLEKNPELSQDKIFVDFKTTLRMLRAYASGQYKDIPWKTIISLVAAIIYFINPMDIVPDFIPLTGLVDDVSVLLFVFTSARLDLDKFKSATKDESESMR